jgi:hypothetical protein
MGEDEIRLFAHSTTSPQNVTFHLKALCSEGKSPRRNLYALEARMKQERKINSKLGS